MKSSSIADVYIYLNNQTAEKNDATTEHIKPTDLINRCKDILNKYEVDHDSNVEQAYLEMNGNNKIGAETNRKNLNVRRTKLILFSFRSTM